MSYEFDCPRCGQTRTGEGPGTGYGSMSDGSKVCYECCADIDRQTMSASGRYTLYLSKTIPSPHPGTPNRAEITNWPGTLRFYGLYSVGRHNIAGKRYDVDFVGPDGYTWHGVTYGDDTQICHVRRTRRKAI